MPRTAFRFDAAWQVAAPPACVADVLVDLAEYPRWWPEIRAVAGLADDRAWVICRSRLPYTLELVLAAVRTEPPTLEVEVAGDLEGWVRLHLAPADAAGLTTRVVLEQEVDVVGPMALVARLLRPAAAWNHHRMVAGMQRGLQAYLAAVGAAVGAAAGAPEGPDEA